MADETESDRLAIIEERLAVGSVPVVTGRVRVSTVTETVMETAQANLRGIAVEVTRVPVDRVVSTAPDIRVEGDVTIVPVVEERLVVATELVLTEEIHIRRQPTQRQVDVPVTLRRQRAVVDRCGTDVPSTEQTSNPKGSDR